jgi:hypothetical protein
MNQKSDALISRLLAELVGQAVDAHEINPDKFGGSRTDAANKVSLPRDVHRKQVTPWWNGPELELPLGSYSRQPRVVKQWSTKGDHFICATNLRKY